MRISIPCKAKSICECFSQLKPGSKFIVAGHNEVLVKLYRTIYDVSNDHYYNAVDMKTGTLVHIEDDKTIGVLYKINFERLLRESNMVLKLSLDKIYKRYYKMEGKRCVK